MALRYPVGQGGGHLLRYDGEPLQERRQSLVTRHGQCRDRAAVVRGLAGDDLAARLLTGRDRVLPQELDGDLHCLAAPPGQTRAFESGAGQRRDPLRKLHVRAVARDPRIGEVHDPRLTRHGLNDADVPMPDIADDGTR